LPYPIGWIAPLPQRHLQFAPCGCITVPEVYPVIPVISTGFSLGNIYMEPAVAMPGLNTKFLRYLPSAEDKSDREIVLIAPLHLLKLLIISGPRSLAKKISISTWSSSRGLQIVGKVVYSCILKWCRDFKRIFTHEAEDNKLYKSITKDIVDGATHEFTLQDIKQDPNWIT
jgi:hypothetical protein